MNQKLSFGFKSRFALAELGFMTLRSMADFFLLFFCTDVAGINPAIAGSALLLGKLTWDAINDPLFGYWSDRTRSRFGRRRIYMLIAAAPLAIATWVQFSIPQGLTGVWAFLSVLFAFWLKDTVVTLAIIPYYALAPEVTRDYQERSSLALYRSVGSVIGYMLGAAGIPLVVGLLQGADLSLQSAWSTTAGAYGLLAAAMVLTTALTIKEKLELAGEPSKIPPFKAILTCFKNRPFVLLMLVFIMSTFAFTVQAALFPYLIQYQLKMSSQSSIILIIPLATTAVFILPAKLLSDKINKAPAYALGLFIVAATFIATFFFMPDHPTPLIYIIAVMLGIGFSAHWVIPYAILPDVIEYDEKMTGERREGIYYGMNNFLLKFSAAVGIAVPGWALNWFGYVPNVVQTDHALFGIRLFYAIIPAAAVLICLPILFRYPITRKSHAILVQELADRKNQASERTEA